MKRLSVNKIVAAIDTQCRESLNQDVVSDYADNMRAGVDYPPVVVFYDSDRYWLADGFHRHAAALVAGLKKLATDVREGSKRDAILFAAGANSSHGLQRSNADKRRAVKTLLDDEEWSRWSNREIASRCGVSDQLVNNMRPTMSRDVSGLPKKVPTVGTFSNQNATLRVDSDSPTPPPPATRLYTTKTGKTAEMTVVKPAVLEDDSDDEYNEDTEPQNLTFSDDPIGYTLGLVSEQCLERGLAPEKVDQIMTTYSVEQLERICDGYNLACSGGIGWPQYFRDYFDYDALDSDQPTGLDLYGVVDAFVENIVSKIEDTITSVGNFEKAVKWLRSDLDRANEIDFKVDGMLLNIEYFRALRAEYKQSKGAEPGADQVS